MRPRAPSPVRVVALGLALQLGAATATQEPAFGGGWTAPEKRFDLAPTLTWLCAPYANEEVSPTVADVSWTMLALMADGTTMRTGPHRQRMRQLVLWLRERQDEQGRFAPDGAPCARADQLLATYAMTRACVASSYTLLVPNACRGLDAFAAALDAAGAAPADAEELALLALTAAEVGRHAGLAARAGQRPRELTAAARVAVTPGRDRRTDGALHLAGLLLGETYPKELTVARCWPPNPTGDPWLTLFGAHALRLTDQQTWQQETELLHKLLLVRTTDGADAGSWPGSAGLDQRTATAMLAIAVGLANHDPFAERK